MLFVALWTGMTSVAVAEQTRIDVRAISKGAKFIGTSMGGAEITIHDADTGKLLAEGKTTGSTGDTEKIMKEQMVHHAQVSTDDAAVFRTTLELDQPRRIKVTARGPLAQPQATASASVTQWIVPGKHIMGGDALTLEIPGFVVDVLNPPAHKKIVLSADSIELRANVTMICGCPIEPNGLWDADKLQIAALITRDGEKMPEVPLKYAGSTSQFIAHVNVDKPGIYEITVYAFDPSNGNTGVDKTTVVLVKQ